MDCIELVSHAKINLTLEVSGRRADGYHDLDSIVQIIDLKDELVLCKAPAGVLEINTNAKGVPSGRGNLVYRACEAFFEATKLAAGAQCTLVKTIPAQAGLGGGSGNAAAAIVGLNQLYKCGLSLDDMADIAAKVGSDAALFVYGGTVRMRGRGEQIKTLPDAPKLHLVVIKPEVGVSTAWAYSELDKSPARQSTIASDNAEQAIQNGDRDALIRSLYNDFDPIASNEFTEIQDAKRVLSETGAEGVLLAGSGSAVFGIFPTDTKAQSAADVIQKTFKTVFVTNTIPRLKANN